jgi:RNA polymerase sigma-70 factor (ECF subfamily)
MGPPSDVEAIMTSNDDDAIVFEEIRKTLMGVAYRVLGSTADAADAVQDTYLIWLDVDKSTVRNARAWLVTVVTRRAMDLSKAASRSRTSYVGTWLPAFVHTETGDDPAEQVALASSLSTAFMLLLERLTPKERAAYVLREVFDFDYADLSVTLDTTEAACRQLVARARRNVGHPEVRHHTSAERQQILVDSFRDAIANDKTAELAALLAEDVALSADSGGHVPTIRETLQGRDDVLAFLRTTIAPYWRKFVLLDAEINAGRGLELVEDDRITAAVSFDFDEEGRVTNIFIMRNPHKLDRLHRAPDQLQ